MPIYFLDDAKTKKLQVKPKGFWKNTEIIYNDNLIDTIATRDELRAGRTYELEPGMSLHVCLFKNGFREPEMIDLKLNGKMIKGSASDPMNGINAAFVTMIFIGALNLIVGLIGMTQDEDGMLAQMGVGGISALLGVVFIGLAFLFRATKTLAPVIVAMVLVVGDMILTLFVAMDQGSGRFPTGVGLKVLLLFWLYRGIKGVTAYQEQKKKSEM